MSAVLKLGFLRQSLSLFVVIHKLGMLVNGSWRCSAKVTKPQDRRTRHVCVRLVDAVMEEGTMYAALQNYKARMWLMPGYIDRHLDSDPDLGTVSRVAAISKFPSSAVYGDLRVVRASLCPACPHEARFPPAGLQGRSKRHGYSSGCWLDS